MESRGKAEGGRGKVTRVIELNALGAGGKPLATQSLARPLRIASLIKLDSLLQNSLVLRRAVGQSTLVHGGFRFQVSQNLQLFAPGRVVSVRGQYFDSRRWGSGI